MAASRILVVEDESIVALHLRTQLMKLGYDVPEAVATGDSALHGIETSRPDLVLMDINLKGDLDGIATVSLIPPAYHVPVIYLTAYAEEATVARACATNPFGYLLKPFHERELHASIQMALSRCRAEQSANAVLESRLHAEKMASLGQLAGDLADDFDNLLSVIYGQLEVLGQHAMEHRAMAQPIENAFGEAIEKERLIRRLLAFSGRQTLAPRVVSVNQLVSGVTNQLRHMLGERIQIHMRVTEDLWNAWIDASQLTTALVNLAKNARDAMPDGGSVTIEGRNATFDEDPKYAGPEVSRRCVLLTLSDTGSGMSNDVIKRAFEPFFTTKPVGQGLGLSLVFGFVRQSGGHISIDSESGRGTSVRLYLPTEAPKEADEPPRVTIDHEPLVGPRFAPGLLAINGASTAAADRKRVLSSAPTLRQDNGDRRGHSSPIVTNRYNTAPVAWHKAGDALFASAPSKLGEARYRLIVEPLLRSDGWDWAVWRPGDSEETLRHGRASTVLCAMTAAEATARQRAETDPLDD
jgi:signal transduction histidine kinase